MQAWLTVGEGDQDDELEKCRKVGDVRHFGLSLSNGDANVEVVVDL